MKKTYKYIIILLCCIGSIQQNNAQNINIKNLFKKVAQSYNDKKQYQIDVTYTMYRGLTGNTITESYQGKMVKNNEFSQMTVLNSEILQFPGGQLNIDHTSKTATYIGSKGTSSKNQLLDINSFLDFYDKVKVTEKNGVLVCEMVSAKPNIQNQYGKVILYINKEKYLIEKQELFFSTLIPFVDGNTKKMDYGRLIVHLKNRELESSAAPVLKDYIHVLSKQNITLAEQYKEYHLTNQAH
ncbi:hypothetical protein ATO12_06885 [Aquimarina atlantica]|uniref:Uncharacterized protein n=1 Tax=Aquimarina atlantica TaxID=1317122 RepID=A0A023BNJ6_9FLAO|nr:hypothetical protein [Aquimarina atlantica]EZH71526.1 hypothetical protein ATO12_06885 [Aquimarina atlantica]